MKKLVFILIAFMTIGSVNAQDGPSKKETFEYIVMMINSSSTTNNGGLRTNTIVIDSDYEALSLKLQENTRGFADGSKTQDLSILPLEDLKSLIDIEEDLYYDAGVYNVTIKSKKKYEHKVYKNGSLYQTYDDGQVWIGFKEKQDGERLIKALKHLQNLIKGNINKSLFDD